jgi:predicted permease
MDERRERDLDDELAFDLAADTEERIAAGMSRRDAEHASRKDFGSVLVAKERSRATWRGALALRILRDFRYALRQLARSPGFATVAVLTLALGIGVNTAVFSVIDVVMLQALPVPHPEQLARITRPGPLIGKDSGWTRALFTDFRAQQDVFDGVFGYGSTGRVDLNDGGEPRPVNVGLVTGDFFRALGVRATAGRLLADADDRAGCPAVAILTHEFWQSEFAGRPDVVGTTIHLSGQPFEIAGVAEPPFFGIEFGYGAPVWTSQCATRYLRPGTTWQVGAVVGRLKPGVTISQAQSRLAAMKLGAVPFDKGDRSLHRNYGDALLIVMAVSGVVLLIACANLAGLLLARAAAREREIAVRMAIGAGRGAIVRQLLTESLLLSTAGALAGIVVARWAGRALVALLAGPRPLPLDLSPDWRVLVFSIAAAALTGILFGLVPAWRASRVDLQSAMKVAGRPTATRTRGWLVAAQVALSLVLVAASGLLVSTWRRIAAIDPGFRPQGVLVVETTARAPRYTTDSRLALYARIHDRLRSLPGVTLAAESFLTPFSYQSAGFPVSEGQFVPFNEIGPGYLAAIGARLIAGRDLTASDGNVAIVTESFARRFFGDAAAIGHELSGRRIIGVIADIKDESLRDSSGAQVYLPIAGFPPTGAFHSFVIRTPNPTALAPQVRAVLADLDPHLTVAVRSLQSRIDESLSIPRSLGLLSGFFGVLAVLLSALGLYGVVQYGVARRRAEIGVRMALGASGAQVVRAVLRDAARVVGIGIAIGLPLAVAANRLLTSFLYGVDPADAAILIAAAVTLVVAAAAAAFLPARRAAALDPIAALRHD